MKNLPKLRKSLYAVAVAVSALLVALGYIDTAQEGVYLGLVNSLLGLAFYNVDTSSGDADSDGI